MANIDPIKVRPHNHPDGRPVFSQSFGEMMADIDRDEPPARLTMPTMQVNFRIPVPYHKILKLKADRAGVSMTEVVVGLIGDYIRGAPIDVSSRRQSDNHQPRPGWREA